jgi:hypothetical protein
MVAIKINNDEFRVVAERGKPDTVSHTAVLVPVERKPGSTDRRKFLGVALIPFSVLAVMAGRNVR